MVRMRLTADRTVVRRLRGSTTANIRWLCPCWKIASYERYRPKFSASNCTILNSPRVSPTSTPFQKACALPGVKRSPPRTIDVVVSCGPACGRMASITSLRLLASISRSEELPADPLCCPTDFHSQVNRGSPSRWTTKGLMPMRYNLESNSTPDTVGRTEPSRTTSSLGPIEASSELPAVANASTANPSRDRYSTADSDARHPPPPG